MRRRRGGARWDEAATLAAALADVEAVTGQPGVEVALALRRGEVVPPLAAAVLHAAGWRPAADGDGHAGDRRSDSARVAGAAAPPGGSGAGCADDAWLRRLADAHEHTRRADPRAGAVYTPDPLADVVARLALAPWIEPAELASARGALPVVLDPACGAGALLLAAARALAGAGYAPSEVARCLVGRDIDGVATRIAAARVEAMLGAAGNFAAADALVDAMPVADVVVGNPPFGNAIERATGRDEATTHAHRVRFPRAARGAYDVAALFVEQAIGAVGRGGRAALVVPASLLSAGYAAGLRAWVDDAHALRALRLVRSIDTFTAARVGVCVVLIEAGAGGTVETEAAEVAEDGGLASRRVVRRVDGAGWASIAAPPALSVAMPADWVRLDARLVVHASATAEEAYAYKPHVSDAQPARGWRLVTAGSIEPLACLWGASPTRYLGERYAAPWLSAAGVSARRAAQFSRPKVLVAGLSAALEAWYDADGAVAGAVSTIVLSAPVRGSEREDGGEGRLGAGRPAAAAGDDHALLRRVCLWLNSAAARTQFAATCGAQSLGGQNASVTKSRLGALRAPPGLFLVAWEVATPGAAAAVLAAATEAAPPASVDRLPDAAYLAALELAAGSVVARPGLLATAVWAAIDMVASSDAPPAVRVTVGNLLFAAAARLARNGHFRFDSDAEPL